jgi:hypothetical protein
MNTNLNHPLIMRTMKVTSIPAYAAFLFVAVLPAAPLAAYSQAGNHTCGAANVHNPSTTYGTATDIDGNAYKTVVIDDKVWFAENLKVTHFQNGDAIPQVSDSADWNALTGPGMCSYRNDPAFDCPYGKLYNHHVVADQRNPCPSGWRYKTQPWQPAPGRRCQPSSPALPACRPSGTSGGCRTWSSGTLSTNLR